MSSQRAVARLGPAALVALLHVVIVSALLHLATQPNARNEVAANEFIAFAFIPASRPREEPAPVAVPAVTPRPTPAPRQPALAITAPPATDQQQEAAPAAPQEAPAPGPRLDMEALRAAARQVNADQPSTAQAPLRAIDDSALAQSVRKAKRPDCQTKYAGGEKADILLLIPLAIETITDKGCKW